MLTNELIFIIHSFIVAIFVIIALRLGKETLVALLCIQAVFSNLFVTKQILFFGLCATCSDVFSVGSSLSLNLLQEYYGKAIAKKTIWVSFFILIFYLLMTQIHLIYIPSNFDITQIHFIELFQFMPRLIFASLIAYLISQNADAFFYAYFRKKFHGSYFLIRNYSSLLISQFIDTVLFTFLGLYGISQGLWQIFIISYGVKVVTIIISTLIVSLCKKLIKTEL